MNPDLTSGLILAGGQGRRMNGADKGLLSLKHTAFAEHLAKILRSGCAHILISCNRNTDTYQTLGDEVFVDETTGFTGPLQGILSARRRLHTPWLLVTPCDTPRLDRRYVERMTCRLTPEPAQIRVAHDGTRLQNLHLLVHHDHLDALNRYLDQGGRSVHGWLSDMGYQTVDFADCPELFINVNTSEDLKRLERSS